MRTWCSAHKQGKIEGYIQRLPSARTPWGHTKLSMQNMRGILLEFLRLWLMLDPFRMLTVRKPHQLVWEIYSLVSPLNFWVHFQNHRTMRHTHTHTKNWQWLKSSLSCFHFIICLFLDYQKMFLDDSYLFFRLIHITIYILLVDKARKGYI